jgi:hypothetical protein
MTETAASTLANMLAAIVIGFVVFLVIRAVASILRGNNNADIEKINQLEADTKKWEKRLDILTRNNKRGNQ